MATCLPPETPASQPKEGREPKDLKTIVNRLRREREDSLESFHSGSSYVAPTLSLDQDAFELLLRSQIVAPECKTLSDSNASNESFDPDSKSPHPACEFATFEDDSLLERLNASLPVCEHLDNNFMSTSIDHNCADSDTSTDSHCLNPLQSWSVTGVEGLSLDENRNYNVAQQGHCDMVLGLDVGGQKRTRQVWAAALFDAEEHPDRCIELGEGLSACFRSRMKHSGNTGNHIDGSILHSFASTREWKLASLQPSTQSTQLKARMKSTQLYKNEVMSFDQTSQCKLTVSLAPTNRDTPDLSDNNHWRTAFTSPRTPESYHRAEFHGREDNGGGVRGLEIGGKGWSAELGKDSFSLHQNAVNIVPQRADLPSLAVPNLLSAFNPPHTHNCSQSHIICRDCGSERGTHIKETANSIFSPSHRSIEAKRRERAGQVDQSSTLSNEHKTHSKFFQRYLHTR